MHSKLLSKAAPAKIVQKITLPVVDDAGIFGPVTSLAASLAVAEIMKLLLGEKTNKLLNCDAWDAKIKITKI